MKLTAIFIAGFLALSSLAAPLLARAESSESSMDFFPKDSAATVFGREIAMRMPKMKDSKPEEDASKTVEAQPDETGKVTEVGSSSEDADVLSGHDNEADTQSLRDKLSKKYGDPNSEPKLRVQEDAPPSMKGMMEALDAGNNEVAYDYARQYVRYTQKYQKALGSVMRMTGQVIKDAGQAQGTDWEKSQATPEEQLLALRKADERVNSLMSRAEKAEMGEISVSDVQRTRDRAAIRAFLATQKDLQPDASGAVDIVAFFELGQEKECWTIGEMRRVMKIHGMDSRVTIVAASVKPVEQQLLDSLRQKANLPFALKDGSVLAQKLGVTQSCALAAIVPNQKRAIVEPGSVTFEFIDELITKLQGARPV